jgi:hypothetical protein
VKKFGVLWQLDLEFACLSSGKTVLLREIEIRREKERYFFYLVKCYVKIL